MVKITLPDGSSKKYDKGITGYDIAKSIGEGLARAALAVKVDGELKDLSFPIENDAAVQILTFRDEEGVIVFRHSSAHLLAEAVVKLFPNAKPTIGPVVEEGFYYDFDSDPFHPEDLVKIEEEINKIVKQDIKFERIELSKAEAKKLFKGNKYKLELIEEFEGNISAYKHGDFVDLCRGPHVPSTGYLKAFKLMKIAGAYWRGDAKNKMLQRIYGISFPDKKDLKKYVNLLEEASKRDHRKIGKELDLFSIHDEAPGMPFFHDKGNFIFQTLVDYMTSEIRKLGYEINKTPIILNKDLWLRSGHWNHYKDNMYFTKIDEGEFAVKPMNCPGNLLVFKTKMHSYRDLPLKAGEFGLVHRHELSGVLSGLFRVRVFTQDDAHVFCTEEQLQDQIIELFELVDRVYSTFGFKYEVELSTKPDKAMGDEKLWLKAEKILASALEVKGVDYKLNPGDGAFYGPKVDYHIKDALGRSWQCGTIQLDFSMPEKFDLTYEGADGSKHRPVMLHRAIYGSVERFFGILIEHYAGKFPMWLNPVQIRVLTVADRFIDYANEVACNLIEAGLRVEVDSRTESVGKKIRDSQLAQVNYTIVVGEKEEKDKTVTVRKRNNDVLGAKKVSDFVKGCLKEVEDKV